MRASRQRLLLGLVLVVGGAARCGYDPNPASDTLHCSVDTHLCPEGYFCGSDDKCQKTVESGAAGSSGTAGSSGSAGAGSAGRSGSAGAGTAGASGNVDKFVGHWIFDAASTITVACGNTTPSTKTLKDDYVDVVAGSAANTIVATYYCPWTLDIGPLGASATIHSGQTCMTTDTSTGAVFTWTGSTFTFSATDAANATLSATIGATYKNTDNTSGSCTVKMTGKLAK